MTHLSPLIPWQHAHPVARQHAGAVTLAVPSERELDRLQLSLIYAGAYAASLREQGVSEEYAVNPRLLDWVAMTDKRFASEGESGCLDLAKGYALSLRMRDLLTHESQGIAQFALRATPAPTLRQLLDQPLAYNPIKLDAHRQQLTQELALRAQWSGRTAYLQTNVAKEIERRLGGSGLRPLQTLIASFVSASFTQRDPVVPY